MVVVDGREDEDPRQGLGLDPPALEVSSHIVDKQGVSETDVLPREVHASVIIL